MEISAATETLADNFSPSFARMCTRFIILPPTSSWEEDSPPQEPESSSTEEEDSASEASLPQELVPATTELPQEPASDWCLMLELAPAPATATMETNLTKEAAPVITKRNKSVVEASESDEESLTSDSASLPSPLVKCKASNLEKGECSQSKENNNNAMAAPKNSKEVENNNGGYFGDEEEKDPFGSGDEGYCIYLATSPHPIPGKAFLIFFFFFFPFYTLFFRLLLLLNFFSIN